jgi:DNA-binding beta-propeller fold protein YncE
VKWMKKKLVVACTALLALALLAAPARAAEAPPPHSLLFSLVGFFIGHTPIPPPEGEFEDACGVATDTFGDIYLSDYYHHTIDIYSPSHAYLTQIADPDPDGPCNLALDSAGNLYVNHWHRNVVRFTPSEYPPSESTTYQEGAVIDSNRSTGLAIDPATGDIYINDRTYIGVYEPSGEPVLDEGVPLRIGLGSIGSAYGVAVSDFGPTAGQVYVPDAGDHTVKAYDPSTDPANPVAVIKGAGTPQHGFVSLLDSNVAIDPNDGHLFVADNIQPGFEHPAAVIDEFNPAGEYRGQLAALIDAEPSALALTGAGNVFVTSGNDEEAALLGFGPTEPAHRLEVSKSGAGAGAVSSEPAGIDCGAACAAEYNAGEEVILTAVADPGSAFAGWSGGGCSGTAPCHLTLGAEKTVVAEFEAAPASLGVQAPAVGQALAAASLAPATSPTSPPAHPAMRSERHKHRRHRAHIHKGKRGRR